MDSNEALSPRPNAILGSFYEEDALYLKLPEIPKDTRIASISDVYLILKDRLTKFNESKHSKQSHMMLNYCEKVVKFKTERCLQEAESTIRAAFDAHIFEVITLVNLLPKTSEEAKNLIPTLEEKIGDDKLQDLLDRLSEIHECEASRSL